MFYLSILIATAGLVIYHWSLKRVPKDAHFMWVLACAYVLAAVMCVVAARITTGQAPWTKPTASMGLTLLMLAGGVVLIEIGTLLAYRYGWPLGTAGPASNALSLVLLIPIAFLIYNDRLSITQWAGLALCVSGLILLTKK
jgi:drug/metabolite transporter (DMT)-like permease